MEKVIDHKNIYEMMVHTFRSFPDKDAYRWILDDTGNTGSVTWAGFHEEAKKVSRSLLHMGVEKGDRIAIAGYCSYRWALCDIGSVSIGAVTVGLYHSLRPEDCASLLDHSGAGIVFAEDPEQLEKLESIEKNVPNVKKIVLLSGSHDGTNDRVITFDEFIGMAEKVSEDEFITRVDTVEPSDLASIVYTSGTTGEPRGAMITHDNFIFTCQLVKNYMPLEETDETVLFLPLPHVFARVDVYATLITGITLTFCRSLTTVVDDLKIARPHWFPSVPRVFEKVYIRINEGVRQKGGLALVLFNRAMKIGYRVSDLKLERKHVPLLLRLRYWLATKLIFSKIHQALGGRVRFCVSGAAPLNPAVARFFHAAGIIIIEGYGMTENTSFTNAGKIDDLKFGSVGYPAPGIEQEIADDGEILYRGRNVMKGYYKLPRETANVISTDGWLHTGDTGFLDSDGRLVITGRKKEIIITSGGKNISPARIESLFTTSQVINQVCVVGDGRQFVSALVTLNPDTVEEYARQEGIPFQSINDLIDRPEIIDLVDKEIQQANSRLASYESVKKFKILPEFTIDEKLITPTFKLKKNEIQKKYSDVIEEMYE